MRLSTQLRSSGEDADPELLLARAVSCELAGWDGLWISDHVVQPETIASAYPYSADGRAAWDPRVPQLEALTALALVAARTTRIRLGTAVLVLPQRQPVLVAKQLATIEAAAPGRVIAGVGAGWLAEEFAALGADWSHRGAVLDDAIAILRSCWTGRTSAHDGPAGRLADGLVALPAPTALPLLVGGMSAPALRRAARLGDGWIAQSSCTPAGTAEVLEAVARLRGLVAADGRDPSGFLTVARLSGRPSAPLAEILRPLADAGLDEVVLDAPAHGGEERALAVVRQALR